MAVFFEVEILLQGASSGRRLLAQNGRWDKIPADGAADLERRHFAGGQRAVGEIPQRSFSPCGFVDPLHAVRLKDDVDEKGVVGAIHELADEFNLAI